MPAKVLVIEDEQNIRESIIDTLEFAGYEVVSAPNGREGIDKALSHGPDLILCDIMMPESDGYEVLKAINEHPATLTTPFIFLTAKATKTDQRKGMINGADDYLTKPFMAKDLIMAVQARLERHEQLQQKNLAELESIRHYFNATIPHELRTPLSGILGFLELLEDGLEQFDTDAIKNMLAYMRTAANRLDLTVDNFITYAQLQIINTDPNLVGKLWEFAQAREADLVIRQMAEREAYEFDRRADLEIDLEPTNLFVFQDHLSKLAKMLINNGFKFSKLGTPVKISGQTKEGQYHFSVTNEGRGFTPEQIANIGAFTQFDRERHEQQGTGLGLAIAKKVLEIYEGELIIESLPDETTTVTAIFKRHPVNLVSQDGEMAV